MKKYVPYIFWGVLAAAVAIGIGYYRLRAQRAESSADRLRSELARADTTRRIAQGAFVRMVQETSRLHADNDALNDTIAARDRQLVFYARRVRILSARVDSLERMTTTPTATPGVFAWGPREVSLGFIAGRVFCDSCVAAPDVTATFTPKPLEFDVGLLAHRDLPWEVLITLQNLDESFRVTVDQPPQIADWLRDAVAPPCRSRLLGFLPTFCDAMIEAGAGYRISADLKMPVGAWFNASTGVGTTKFRLNVLGTSEPSVFVGPSIRLK